MTEVTKAGFIAGAVRSRLLYIQMFLREHCGNAEKPPVQAVESIQAGFGDVVFVMA